MNFTRGYGVQQSEGLTRQEYQQIVAAETGPGVSAARAAQKIKQTGYHDAYAMDSSRGRYRTPWQEAISRESRDYGLSAVQAAQELAPYWAEQRSRSRSRSPSPTARVLPQASLGYSNGSQRYGYDARSRYQTSGYNQSRGSSGRSMSEKASEVVMTPKELGIRSDQFAGLDREGYQTLLSELSGRGVSAADAAQALKQAGYLSQKSVPHLSPRQWNTAVSSMTGPGVNAAQAAKQLSPRYHGATETGSSEKYLASNATVSVASGAAQGELGVPRSLGSVGDVRGKTSSVTPFTEGYGMYEGQGARSFRAGTPAKETDVVLSPAEAAAVNAPQHSPRSAETRVTNRPELNFVEHEVRQIARALGINDEGMNKTTLVSAIKNSLRDMAPERATQFMGSLSPRTRQQLSNKRGY